MNVPLPVPAPAAGVCDNGQCECTVNEGNFTAEVTQAVCALDGNDACDNPASICEDDTTVACEECKIEMDKQVAKDDNCDGVADGPFSDSVTQDTGECVV